MSRAFNGLTFAAAGILILVILGRAIKIGANGISVFIEKNYVAIYIVLSIIALILCVIFYYLTKKANEINKGFLLATSITVFFAIAQNFVFLVYGFYRALTAYIDAPFLTIIAVGGFVVVYAIDTFVTIAGILYSSTKKRGAVIPVLITIAGTLLIIKW